MGAAPLDVKYFEEIRSSTSGMMPAETYHEYYRIAFEESRSNIIDIGVGRGPTSISFALGVRHSGRKAKVYAIDQFYQHTRGPHLYSLASNPHDCVTLNVAEFERNVQRYGVSDLVETWTGKADEVAQLFPRDIRADVLAIDACGSIDSHFMGFYDLVEPDGLIILDDCADFVDRTGRERIERMRGKPASEVLAWVEQQGRSNARLLLGKHLLTYELARYFEKIGVLKKERGTGKAGKTVIFRKVDARLFASLDLSGIAAIEAALIERFVHTCRI